MKRSEIREAAFLLVFEKEIRRDDTIEEIIESAKEADEYDFNKDTVEIFRGVYDHLTETDEIISRFSDKRQLSRIHKVSLAVLRIAVYEINHCDRVPTNVAISEAVNITKKFALDAEVQFVNGVLGAYSRSLPKNTEAES
ncbi:MAG: transcription antitermination factor NusB [Oscillospiraceae bacterium]|nr:transcription antitermination factor NusB [Oscillospiraceae bacterium]MBQ8826288.1 transcription antitermination factor NusB [Oscillospiraceae bacterium]